MLPKFLRLFAWSARNSKRKAKTRRVLSKSFRSALKLGLEPLEDRRLLSVMFWDGAGPDKNWSTAANWAGGIAPSAGDSLIFPTGVTQTSANNDFAAGTTFGSIVIAGSGYTLSGHAVALQAGLSDSGGGASVSLPITQDAAQRIVNTSGGTPTLNGAINENSFPLTLEADGSTSMMPAVGSGQITVNPVVASTATATTLTASAGTLSYGQTETLTATVTASGSHAQRRHRDVFQRQHHVGHGDAQFRHGHAPGLHVAGGQGRADGKL